MATGGTTGYYFQKVSILLEKTIESFAYAVKGNEDAETNAWTICKEAGEQIYARTGDSYAVFLSRYGHARGSAWSRIKVHNVLFDIMIFRNK